MIVVESLGKRGSIIIDYRCVFCGEGIEMKDYLFRLCDFMLRLWFYDLLGFNFKVNINVEFYKWV